MSECGEDFKSAYAGFTINYVYDQELLTTFGLNKDYLLPPKLPLHVTEGPAIVAKIECNTKATSAVGARIATVGRTAGSDTVERVMTTTRRGSATYGESRNIVTEVTADSVI